MRHLLTAAILVLTTADAWGQETPLDTRRRLSLEKIDQSYKLGPANSSYPGPNLTLQNKYWEYEYEAKILSIFGLVDLGVEPAGRIAEANKLLRSVLLGQYKSVSANSLAQAQSSPAWKHRARSLAFRIWLLYSGWVEPDLKQEFLKRFQWLLLGPFTNSSENIQFNNNEARFLAHEILGKQSLFTYAGLKLWWTDRLRSFGKDGAHEWGTTYNGWTIGSVLNLAEFAQDATVQKLATMAVDYWLARMSGFQIEGYFGSGAVRRYYHWTFAHVPPQTHIARVLFFGPASFTGWTDDWPEWAVSNFKPLTSVQGLYQGAGPGEARITEKDWRHAAFRGSKFLLATQTNFQEDYYGQNAGTHDVITSFVQSAKHPRNQVVAYGLPIGLDTKWRSTVDRSFGYRNVSFVNHGGYCKRTWTGGEQHDIPTRLFYTQDFSVELQSNWAFLTDGFAYVAWAPTIGAPIADPQSEEFGAYNNQMGSWLRSDAVPTDAGETCVVEAGDAASFGSFENFKNDILSRNPNPTWLNNQVTYKAKDGSVLVFGTDYATVNGQFVDPDSHPRAQMAGVSGFAISGGIAFNFDAATTTGTLARVAANHSFGQTGPLPLAITTPATLPSGPQGQGYSKTLEASGGLPPYGTWIKIWGTLPPGLVMNGSSIVGTPSALGTFTFRIRVKDSAGAMTSRLFSLTIGPPIPLTITTPSTLPNGKKGVAYSKTLAASGGSGVYVTWVKIWGTTPPGISLNGGALTGTPAAIGTWTFRIRVIDSSGSITSRLFSLKVNP